MTASKTVTARDTKFRNIMRGMVNRGYMSMADLQDLATRVGASPARVSVYLSNARTRGAKIVRKKVDGVTMYRLQKLPVVWTGRFDSDEPVAVAVKTMTETVSTIDVNNNMRPGDAAAVYAEETGIPYSEALVAMNMD